MSYPTAFEEIRKASSPDNEKMENISEYITDLDSPLSFIEMLGGKSQ